jgi:hypothetical protein
MDWQVTVTHREGEVTVLYATTRAEARECARRMRRWPDVVKATVSRVGN